MPRRRAPGRSVAAAVLAVLLAGCSSFVPGSREESDSVVPAAPRQPLTVVFDADPVAAAVTASRTLFSRSELAVVAQDGDRAGTLLGAAAAVGLGVPLLVGNGSALANEVDRLGVRRVLA